MNTLGENIRKRLKDLSMTQAELGKRVGISQVMVHKLLSGKSAETAKIVQIAKVLDCSPDWLLHGGEGSNSTDLVHNNQNYNNNVSPVPFRRVPVISYVQAGEATESIDMFEPGFADEYLPCPVPHSENTYALRVKGDSMTSTHGRSYPEGAVIFVDPDLKGEIKSGDRIIAKMLNSGEVTFKCYISDSGKQFLKPLNTSYPLITEPFEVLGKIIGMWMPE